MYQMGMKSTNMDTTFIRGTNKNASCLELVYQSEEDDKKFLF